jgi:hypothetical protein
VQGDVSDNLEKGIIFSRYWFKSVIRNPRQVDSIMQDILKQAFVDLFMQDILKHTFDEHFMPKTANTDLLLTFHASSKKSTAFHAIPYLLAGRYQIILNFTYFQAKHHSDLSF